jgi:hypothetical protein
MKRINTEVENALRARSFDSLAIKRIDRECYLVVTVAGAPHILTDHAGRHMTFRHARQIRHWLQDRFQITTDSIAIETYQ